VSTDSAARAEEILARSMQSGRRQRDRRAIRKVHEIVKAIRKTFLSDQYSNPANWQAHYHTTANEIWQQTSGRITRFVTGLGRAGFV
jgi:cysteine synthase